ncbi:dynactin subunit 6, putative [Plasmodium yoelii]|uniref:Dynactin subunit 6 n=2 Tax=Plasmodium yoelii TaxID=5861 RepID=A0AAF0B1A9_PLAYO|nr:dynactin subunit 6, putative [Plasmodium yoelii]WBY56353.1 dynactin subunit 6 [Plasmodium yoelii yoelii]CDU17247.1 dynactin subunit 6, putative [Plasmodium yoelii]VTZ76432.1 dynactin subunit 6, putative [Plasmodium yoelii]|eukprot:XP_022811799.1 dynactin subunit 6, putative [Plasmodium yoelii]
MNNSKFVKLLSLNLDRNIDNNFERKNDFFCESDISSISSYDEIKSNSLLGLISINSFTNDSKNSIKSENLNPFKRVHSLNEYTLNYKKLWSEKSNALLFNNIFTKFNTNHNQIYTLNSYENSNTILSWKYESSEITFDSEPNDISKKHSCNFKHNPSNDNIDSFIYTDTFNSDVSKQIKNRITNNESPLSFYLNQIQNYDLNKFNQDKNTLINSSQFIKINKEINKTDFFKDTKEVIPAARKMTTNSPLKKNATNYILKYIRRYNEYINGTKLQNYRAIKKMLQKIRKACRSIMVKKFHNKNMIGLLMYMEKDKKVMKLWKDKSKYLHKKNKNKRYFLQLFYYYVISFYLKKNSPQKKKNLCYMDKCIAKILFQNKYKEINTKTLSNNKTNTNKSYVLGKLNQNIILGKGNSIFPGSTILATTAKIYIGDHNLFEDNVTIINNTNKNMYIGNYNIFRSGTHIINSLKIGSNNYFDYKSTLYNCTINGCVFVKANILMNIKEIENRNPYFVNSTITNIHPIFIKEHTNEIKLRYNHMNNSE